MASIEVIATKTILCQNWKMAQNKAKTFDLWWDVNIWLVYAGACIIHSSKNINELSDGDWFVIWTNFWHTWQLFLVNTPQIVQSHQGQNFNPIQV